MGTLTFKSRSADHQKKIEESLKSKRKIKFIRKIHALWEMEKKVPRGRFTREVLLARQKQYGVEDATIEKYFPELAKHLFGEKKQKPHTSEESSDKIEEKPKEEPKKRGRKPKQKFARAEKPSEE